MRKRNWKCWLGAHQWEYSAYLRTSKPDFSKPIETSMLKHCAVCGRPSNRGMIYREAVLYHREPTIDEQIASLELQRDKVSDK